jgi:ATP-dependent Clp protease ATP-binding subunit ClpA
MVPAPRRGTRSGRTLRPLFERFTERARRVVVLAQEEARTLNHHHIGTEHILLGVIHEGEGVAAKALEALEIPLETARREVERMIGVGHAASGSHIPFTPRAKKVLELSLREALQLGHNYIGTEHILLGLIREGEGVAAQVLQKLGADQDRVRVQILALLGGFDVPEGVAEAAREAREEEEGDELTGRVRTKAPQCPTCKASLPAHARWTRLEVSGGRGEIERGFLFVSCDVCDTNLGVTPP